MSDIVLVTSANGPYLPRMWAYLDDLQKRLNPEIQVICMTVDCGPPDWAADVPKVQFIPISAEQNYGTSESTSVEHGSFLEIVGVTNDDLVIYTNGDLRLQRPLSEWEMRQIKEFPYGSISAGWNAGHGDTLADEARRLTPKVDGKQLEGLLPGHADMPCFNMGVFMARGSAYKRIYERYMAKWETVCMAFQHYARQQWGVCYAAGRMYWIEMSNELSAHGHYGLPPGVAYDGRGAVYYLGRPVAWRHKL